MNKGGYRPASRLATLLDEVRMEAMVARVAESRQERDRAFDEIQRLVLRCAQLLERPDVAHAMRA